MTLFLVLFPPTMSAVLRMPANNHDPQLVRDKLKKYSASAFTAINGGSSSLWPHNLTGLECLEAWERVPREPGFRPFSDSTDPIKSAGNRPHEIPSERETSHSIQTGYLCGSLGKEAVRAERLPTASFVEQETTEHRLSADLQDCNENQGHKSSTLERLSMNVPLGHKDTAPERNRSASDKAGTYQRSDRIPAVKRRTRTGCGTCRKRKKKCDEAKPECENCQRGNLVCTGYSKQITWSKKNNAAHAPPALPPHQRISSAEVPAHIVQCPVCNVIHNPQCEPSQKIYAESKALGGITTAQDWPVCTDEQGRELS